MRQLIDRNLRTIQMDAVIKYLNQLCRYDRYQASSGIEQAAAYVAEIACQLGLQDVRVDRFVADGAVKWWTFEAPVSWTPTIARLEIFLSGRSVFMIDHFELPFTIATHSASTQRGGFHGPLVDFRDVSDVARLQGAIVLLDQAAFSQIDIVRRLSAGGIAGFVTDGPWRGHEAGPAHPGRLELEKDSRLFAFSVTPEQLIGLRRWAAAGAEGHVVIQIDRDAAMPVVTGLLPGDDGGGEIWLTAHLCHPRPGANDNASGVAALLGLVPLLRNSRGSEPSKPRKAVRFIWGPEFLGMASLLHCFSAQGGRSSYPAAVINLDMVGEDQAVCGGPFVMERHPDCIPSLLNVLAEEAVECAFDATRTHGGFWRSSPFFGLSDHALFADPKIASPAVQFCHMDDRFNHSAGDTIEKVSETEMCRAVVAAAALTDTLASNGEFASPEMWTIVERWCGREEQAILRAARQNEALDGGRWASDLMLYGKRQTNQLRALAKGEGCSGLYKPNDVDNGPLLRACWDGPINLRAMIKALPERNRHEAMSLLARERSAYVLLYNFASLMNGTRSARAIVDETSFALRVPIERSLADRLIAWFIESEWTTQASHTAKISELSAS